MVRQEVALIQREMNLDIQLVLTEKVLEKRSLVLYSRHRRKYKVLWYKSYNACIQSKPNNDSANSKDSKRSI